VAGIASHSGVLAGQRVAITGRLASMTHVEMAELISACGGEYAAVPNRSTTLLVVGQDGWPLHEDGRPTQNLEKARRLRAGGGPIEMVTEGDFLDRLGLAEQQAAIHRRYTVAQLSRILGIPGARLRAWARAGLIEPVETVYRLAYFDFCQVASAKTVFELASAGVKPQRIRESLEQFRTWLPEVDRPLSQLTLLEQGGRLLLRLDCGLLAEPNGQLQLDFMTGEGDEAAETGGSALVDARPLTSDEWFQQALRLEDQGNSREAAQAYRESLRLEPGDPVLHFNLGNALYACGELEDSVDAFGEAVARDRAYVEAWNNLGSVLAELNRTDEAVRAFRQALQVVPSYADAHYNLADVLSQAGREDEARLHWAAYLRHGPTGPWAEHAEHCLGEKGDTR
jgi:tetratricopeptide (TPR) repeat protein